MKIFFNEIVKYSPWGGGMYFLAGLVDFFKKKGHEILFKLKKNIDLIFIMTNFKELDPRIIKYLKRNSETKVLQRININDKSKKVNHQDNLVFKINKVASM